MRLSAEDEVLIEEARKAFLTDFRYLEAVIFAAQSRRESVDRRVTAE